MKTKAILATLLIAAAASADARFAPPFPRKAVPPDKSGYWIVINGNPWSHDVESELVTASWSPGGPDRRKIIANKGKNIAERGTISLVPRQTIAQELSRSVKCGSPDA